MKVSPRRLARIGLAALTSIGLVAGSLAVAATSAQAVSACQLDCIGAVTVQPGPEAVRIAYSTTAITNSSLRITTGDGVTKVKDFIPANAEQWSTSRDWTATNLPTQGTLYRYVITATDMTGASWQETGYFSSRVREVTIDWGNLKITDDSDSWGAGELTGGTQISTAPCGGQTKPMAPLSFSSQTSMSTGDVKTLTSAANLFCSKVPLTVRLDSLMVDSDAEDSDDDCPNTATWFQQAEWESSQSSTTCNDWNNGQLNLTDPIAPTATGIGTKSFTLVSKSTTWDGWSSPIEWTLAGVATFSHTKSNVAVPAATTGPLHLALKATGTDKSITTAWTPITTSATHLSGYRVQWRPSGGGAWSYKDRGIGISSDTITGLTNGQLYEVRVQAITLNAQAWALSATTAKPVGLAVPPPPLPSPPAVEPPAPEQPPAPPAPEQPGPVDPPAEPGPADPGAGDPAGSDAGLSPTTVTGWTTVAATLPVGKTVVRDVKVPTLGLSRALVIQYRAPGSTVWASDAILTTAPDGKARIKLPVRTGAVAWRVLAPATGTHAAATTAARTVTAKSTITGFSTKKKSVKVGKKIKDGVKVTPGAKRTVKVQFRKKGTSTWKTYASKTANSSGKVVVKLKAKKGTYQWRVVTKANTKFGSAAVTKVRIIKGR